MSYFELGNGKNGVTERFVPGGRPLGAGSVAVLSESALDLARVDLAHDMEVAVLTRDDYGQIGRGVIKTMENSDADSTHLAEAS